MSGQQSTIACAETPALHAACLQCFQQLASPEELEAFHRSGEHMANGKCEYCSAPATTSSIAYTIPGIMEEEVHRWCAQGRQALAEFDSRPENAIPEVDVGDEAQLDVISRHLAERDRRQTEFMRERVS